MPLTPAPPPPLIRVRASTPVGKLARTIAWSLRELGSVEVSCIGPDAVNQAVKACATARRHLRPRDLIIRPQFTDVVNPGAAPYSGILLRVAREAALPGAGDQTVPAAPGR